MRRYNDELLGHDSTSFSDRLYKTDFKGSKAHENEVAESRGLDSECTFAPELHAAKASNDQDFTGEERINRLYGDAAAIKVHTARSRSLALSHSLPLALSPFLFLS